LQKALIGGTLLVAVALMAVATSEAGQDAGAEVKPVAMEKLPNVPGKAVSAVVANYAPGGKSGKHHDAGSVLAYVLSGEIRSENSANGPAKVYKAGESFFEPPGSEHLVSENARTTEPASLLAIFIGDEGANLTTFDSDAETGSAVPSAFQSQDAFGVEVRAAVAEKTPFGAVAL
jgi:quercetin dioxygenase-like cupin family protein